MGPAGGELRKGPLAHGFVNDQRWTLGRIKTLIGRLFHVGYTVEGTSKLMRPHGWSAQVPVRQAMERDETAVAVWNAEVWPEITARRATWAPTFGCSTLKWPHCSTLIWPRRGQAAVGL